MTLSTSEPVGKFRPKQFGQRLWVLRDDGPEGGKPPVGAPVFGSAREAKEWLMRPVSIRSPLNEEQRAFLRFHADDLHQPYRWAWLDARGKNVTGDPSTWVRLRAWRRYGFNVESSSISRDNLDGLRDYWGDGFTVNAAGRKLVALASGPLA